MGFNIVVLLDLNGFPVGDSESQKQYMKWVHEYLLTTLAKKVTNEAGVAAFAKINWAFKLFNTGSEKGYPWKKFEPFTISSFENFESTSLSAFEKYLPESQDCTIHNKCASLSKALKEVIADFSWDEIIAKKTEEKAANVVYAFLRVPRDEDEVCDFLDIHDECEGSPNSRQLVSALLPSTFLKHFRTKYEIQLNFVDTWVLHKEDNLNSEWDGLTYSRQVVKILDYLNKGKVIQFEKPQLSLPGLPSYFALLKQALSNASVPPPQPVAPLSKAQKVLQSKADSSTHDRPRARLDDSLNNSVSSSSRSRPKSMPRNLNDSGRYNLDHSGNGSDLFDAQSGSTDESSVSENYGMDVFSKRGEQELTRFVRQVHAGSSKRQSLFKEPTRRDRYDPRHSLLSRSAPQNRIKHYRKETNPIMYSRTLQIAQMATRQEHNKWRSALEKEEQERNQLRMERREALLKLETLLELMKTRLCMFIHTKGLEGSQDVELLLEAVLEFQEKYIADEKTCVLSLAQTVVQFVVDKVTLNAPDGRPANGEDARRKLEDTLYTPISELRSSVIRSKNDDAQFLQTLRLCQYQILVRMESSFLLPVSADVTDNLRDDIVDLLNLLSVYVKNRVDDFLNQVLLWGYLETHSEMLIRLYRGLNMDPPKSLILVCTPSKSVASRSSFRGSSIASPFGSMESLLGGPMSSSSLSKHPGTRKGQLTRTLTESSLGAKSNKSSARSKSHVYVNNPKKMLVVPVRNVRKFGVKPASNVKPAMKSPKPASASRTRVRRNLFDDLQNPSKLLQFSGRTKSPSAKSQSSHASLKLRNLRSKRRLNLDEFDDDDDELRPRKMRCLGDSPEMFSPGTGIYCPGTPSYKPCSSAKKSMRSPEDQSPGEKVIAASPDGTKAGNIFADGIHTSSFYSTGSDCFVQKVREKPGNKMVKAKIKRNVESSSFMKTGLTISDIEILGGFASSPESKNSTYGTPKNKRTPASVSENVEVVRANANASIEALIRCNQPLAMLKTTPKGTAVNATPTKKITFNFDENLVKTPQRTSTPGTPRSILKTPSRYDEVNNSTPQRPSRDCPKAPIRLSEDATHFSPTIIDEPGPSVETSGITSEDGSPGISINFAAQSSSIVENEEVPNADADYNSSYLSEPLRAFVSSSIEPNQRSTVFAPPEEDIMELQACQPSSLAPHLREALVSQASNTCFPHDYSGDPASTSFESSFKLFSENLVSSQGEAAADIYSDPSVT